MKKLSTLFFLCLSLSLSAQNTFDALDVYDLEFATAPKFSPDGKVIVYARSFMDVMTDKRLSNLWTIRPDGSHHRPLTSGNHRQGNHRWSPDGSKIAYLSNESGSTQIHILWMDSGRSAQISNLHQGIGCIIVLGQVLVRQGMYGQGQGRDGAMCRIGRIVVLAVGCWQE